MNKYKNKRLTKRYTTSWGHVYEGIVEVYPADSSKSFTVDMEFVEGEEDGERYVDVVPRVYSKKLEVTKNHEK